MYNVILISIYYYLNGYATGSSHAPSSITERPQSTTEDPVPLGMYKSIAVKALPWFKYLVNTSNIISTSSSIPRAFVYISVQSSFILLI